MVSVGRRLRVIGPTLGLMALWVLWFNSGFVGLPSVTPDMSAVFLLGPFAGPFVGLVGPVIGFDADPLAYCIATGLPLLAMIASHPAYPRWWTGILCVAGVLLWFLLPGRFAMSLNFRKSLRPRRKIRPSQM